MQSFVLLSQWKTVRHFVAVNYLKHENGSSVFHQTLVHWYVHRVRHMTSPQLIGANGLLSKLNRRWLCCRKFFSYTWSCSDTWRLLSVHLRTLAFAALIIWGWYDDSLRQWWFNFSLIFYLKKMLGTGFWDIETEECKRAIQDDGSLHRLWCFTDSTVPLTCGLNGKYPVTVKVGGGFWTLKRRRISENSHSFLIGAFQVEPNN